MCVTAYKAMDKRSCQGFDEQTARRLAELPSNVLAKIIVELVRGLRGERDSALTVLQEFITRHGSSQLQSNVENLECTVEGMQDQVDDLDTGKGDLEERVDQLITEKEDLKQTVEQLQERVELGFETLEERVDDMAERLERV